LGLGRIFECTTYVNSKLLKLARFIGCPNNSAARSNRKQGCSVKIPNDEARERNKVEKKNFNAVPGVRSREAWRQKCTITSGNKDEN
jgi:hypothetical protein